MYFDHTYEELASKGILYWLCHHFPDDGAPSAKLGRATQLAESVGDPRDIWQAIREVMDCEPENWDGDTDEGIDMFFNSGAVGVDSERSMSLAYEMAEGGSPWWEIVATVDRMESEGL